MPCHLAEKFSIGHFNTVRQVVIEDGQLWIVRLRMPDLKGSQNCKDVKRAMSSEVAYMRFLKSAFVAGQEIFGINTNLPLTGHKALFLSQMFIFMIWSQMMLEHPTL